MKKKKNSEHTIHSDDKTLVRRLLMEDQNMAMEYNKYAPKGHFGMMKYLLKLALTRIIAKLTGRNIGALIMK